MEGLITGEVSSLVESTVSSSHPSVGGEITEVRAMVDMAPWNMSRDVCSSDFLPSAQEYLTALDVAGVALLSVLGCGVLLILILYVDILKHVINNVPSIARTPSIFVVSVYPVVSMITYFATVVPRAQLLSEFMTQVTVMTCLYAFFSLSLAYSGGEDRLLMRGYPNTLKTRVGPCCCWPCCCCLPTPVIQRKQIFILRILVLQLPVVQGIIYTAELVISAEDRNLYESNFLIFQPVIVVSILFGLWGIVMTVMTLGESLQPFHFRGKFLVLQLMLFLTKLQLVIIRALAKNNVLPCYYPLSPIVIGNIIYNSLIIVEAVVLCGLARLFYKRALPEIEVEPTGASSTQKSDKMNNNRY